MRSIKSEDTARTAPAINSFRREAAKYLGKKPEELKIITCHLGNGSSITAVNGGKCVDTSMGFTPLAGVPMGTRSGDIDYAAAEYIARKEGMDVSEMLDLSQ